MKKFLKKDCCGNGCSLMRFNLTRSFFTKVISFALVLVSVSIIFTGIGLNDIFLEAAAGTSGKELDFAKDTWDFFNFGGPLYLNRQDYNKLLNNASDVEKAEIISDAFDERYYYDFEGGRCWGFAATSFMAKTGKINPGKIQNGANTLHDLKFKKRNEVDSLLSFYQLTAFYHSIQGVSHDFVGKTNSEKVKYIKETAEKVKSGGNPLVLWWTLFDEYDGAVDYNAGISHAIVAFGYESGSYKYEGRKFDGKVLIYDSNVEGLDPEACLYVNTTNGRWIIPYEEGLNSFSGRGELTLAYNNTNLFDKNSSEKYPSYKASLYSNGVDYTLIKNGTNESWDSKDIIYNDYKKSRGLRIPREVSSVESSAAFLPDKEADYTIKNNSQSWITSYLICYDNALLSVMSFDAKSASFSKNGSISLKGSGELYYLSVSVNDSGLPWCMVEVLGEGASNPSLKYTKDGYILSGGKFEDILIAGTGMDIMETIQVNTNKKSILITEDNKKLVAKVDNDNNGTYETVLKSRVSETFDTYKLLFNMGDADDDDKITVKDATAIQKHVAKIRKLSKTGDYLADFNLDGSVNIKDATAIQKYIAGIPTYPSWWNDIDITTGPNFLGTLKSRVK